MSNEKLLMDSLIGHQIHNAEIKTGGFHLELDGGFVLIVEGSFVMGLCQLEQKLH